MAEQSGFFDAHLVDGEYDRVYLAEHFAKYFASFIGNGIFGGKSNELQVREKETASMGVRVLSGQAWIDGYWYENDDEHPLTIDIADGVLNRIDSIVVRWNHSERIIRLAVKKGAAATNPVAPIVQRDDDYYELKLADIYIKAGMTSITQSSITDKRLNTSECGLVIGVVQQLDADEFGIQLETYISEFIAEHNEWKNTTQADIEQWAIEFKTSYENWFIQFKADCNAAVDNLLIENQRRFDEKISELERIAADNDLIQLNQDVSVLKEDMALLKEEGASGMGTEDEAEIGCHYIEAVDGSKEWINAPNKPGIEYRLIERWNGNPVYQKMFYIAALPNKTLAGIHVEVHYQKIIHVSGFAIDNENNMYYPFPIIQNGLTPIAVIQGVESDGSDESDIVIQTNEDVSHMTGYVTVKYTKV